MHAGLPQQAVVPTAIVSGKFALASLRGFVEEIRYKNAEIPIFLPGGTSLSVMEYSGTGS